MYYIYSYIILLFYVKMYAIMCYKNKILKINKLYNVQTGIHI